MKQGKSLVDWAQEIQRQAESKKDFVAATTSLRMEPAAAGVSLAVNGNGSFAVNDHAHGQIAARLDIPKKYYDRMLGGHPELLAHNVNTWFDAKPEKRMIRTLDGTTRAFLSDRYRRLDNADLAEAILPEVLGRGDLQLASCEITERRLYLKMVYPKLEMEVKRGDPVQSGFLIQNSEIGAGRLEVSPFLTRLVCTNGMVATEFGQRRNHVGRSGDSEEEAYELYSDPTLRADDKAFFLKVRDTVRACLEESKFSLIVSRLREATEQRIEGDPLKAVEVVANKYTFAESEKSSFLKHLISGADLTAYGVVQAITRTSQDLEDYDRATEFEALGGKVLALAPSEWKEIATAA